jgi:hypothetical protein
MNCQGRTWINKQGRALQTAHGPMYPGVVGQSNMDVRPFPPTCTQEIPRERHFSKLNECRPSSTTDLTRGAGAERERLVSQAATRHFRASMEENDHMLEIAAVQAHGKGVLIYDDNYVKMQHCQCSPKSVTLTLSTKSLESKAVYPFHDPLQYLTPISWVDHHTQALFKT